MGGICGDGITEQEANQPQEVDPVYLLGKENREQTNQEATQDSYTDEGCSIETEIRVAEGKKEKVLNSSPKAGKVECAHGIDALISGKLAAGNGKDSL